MKKRRFLKILSILLAFVLTISIAPITVCAEGDDVTQQDTEEDGFTLVFLNQNSIMYAKVMDSCEIRNGESIALSEVLEQLGYSGEITSVNFTNYDTDVNNTVFGVEETEDGDWILSAQDPFVSFPTGSPSYSISAKAGSSYVSIKVCCVKDHPTTWNELKGCIETGQYRQGPVTIKLEQDFVGDGTYAGGDLFELRTGDVIVDLNGHTIDRNLESPKSDGCVFALYMNAGLTICDSVGTGVITGGNNTTYGGGICCMGDKTRFKMTGGSICGCSSYQNDRSGGGGGIFSTGLCEISGNAHIYNNTAGCGGGIYYSNSNGETNLTISEQALIENNSADYFGGGLYVTNNGFSATPLDSGMYGGTICGNTAGYSGGGIYVYSRSNYPWDFHINGGEITGNHVNQSDLSEDNGGGGIAVGGYDGNYSDPVVAQICLLGEPVITGNTDADGNPSNIHINRTIANRYIKFDGPLTEGANVGVNVGLEHDASERTGYVFTSGYINFIPDEPDTYFTSDAPEYKVLWSDDNTECRLVKYCELFYDGNGGEGMMTSQFFLAEFDGQVYSTVADNEFTRDCYLFEGWSESQDGSGTIYQPGEYNDLSGEVTLYAQWSAIEPTGLKFDKESVELMEGDRERMMPSYIPENALQRELVWSSSNSSCVTVDSDGYIEAVAPGSAEITVSVFENPSVKTSYNVTVIESPTAIVSKDGVDSIYYDFLSAVNGWIGSGNGATLMLYKDVAIDTGITINIGSKEHPMVLDLNNHGIRYTGSDEDSVITVNSGSHLVLMDQASDYGKTRYIILDENGRGTSVSENEADAGNNYAVVCGGYITGGTGEYFERPGSEGSVSTYECGGGICVFGSLVMNSGTVVGNRTYDSGGGIYVDDGGSFTMNGGIISHNLSVQEGGGLGCDSGSVTEITGGKISRNTANYVGGGVYNCGNITITGGEITGNKAKYGAGMACYQGTLTMTGGSITNNTAELMASGVLIEETEFLLSGSPVIRDNISDNGKKVLTSNIYLEEGDVVTLNGETDAEIGISMRTPGVFTAQAAFENDAAAAAIFSSDDSAYYIDVNEEAQAQLMEVPSNYILAAGISGSFQDMIKLNFYFTVPSGINISNDAYVELTGGNDNRTVTTKFSEAVRDEDGTYIFSIPLAAAEAGDMITANVYDNGSSIAVKGSSGSIYQENELQYSLMNYFDVLKASGDSEEDKILGSAAKDYCSAAQIYFDYNADQAVLSSALDDVTESTLASYVSTREGTKPADVTMMGISAMIEEDNTLRVYLKETGSRNHMIDEDAASLKTRNDGATYLARTEGTAANKLHVPHAYKIMGSDGTAEYTINASVLTYARACVRSSNTNLQNLGKAMYLYNQAAVAKFGE